MIPKEHLLSFKNAVISGHYNLLFGSGISLDSTNGMHEKLMGAEQLRKNLCDLTGAPDSTSLSRVFGLLDEGQIEANLTRPYSACQAGPSLEPLPRYLWQRIFTFNIDDAVENCFITGNSAKQQIGSLNFTDPFEPTTSRRSLQAIHLHGSANRPKDGYVFSLTEYARIMSGMNPWMHLLSEILATEPFIIAGTSLTESDLEYYLSYRTESTPRRGLAPSLLIDPSHSVVSRADCQRHGLIPIDGTFGEFLDWLSQELPAPPTLSELVIPDVNSIFDEELDKKVLLRFFSSFELISATDQKLSANSSAFLYGREPTWSEIEQHVDIVRSETTPIIGLVQKSLKSAEEKRLIEILDQPGTGKSTILRRVGHDLVKLGQPVLSLISFDRLDSEAAIECLTHAKKPVVLLVDGLADHVDQVASILGDSAASNNVVILGAERRYREGHLDRVLGDLPRHSSKLASFTTNELQQLLERYRGFGLVGDHVALRHPKHFIQKLKNDPIAVAVCRILNDFSPLDEIATSLWRASESSYRLPYLCIAIAQHCYRSGLRFSILQKIVGATQSVNAIVDAELPLKLVEHPTDRDFIIAMNVSIADRVLIYAKRDHADTVFEAFVAIANALAPRVNRRAIMRRTPEARLAGRLFDYDTVVQQYLGEKAELFYIEVQAAWEWNSRYWEQRALLKSETDMAAALQYARHAVAIELHPFPLTTLGKLLFNNMEEPGGRNVNFEEGFDRLSAAIEIETKRMRSSVHPFLTMFAGCCRYLDLGGNFTPEQRLRIEVYRDQAKYKFESDETVQHAVARLESI